LSIRISVS